MENNAFKPVVIHTGNSTEPVSVSKAILDGYAPDNELYTFKHYPEISAKDLESYRNETYANVFYSVTQKLLANTIPDHLLRETANLAYGEDKFDFDDDHNLRFTTLSNGIEIVGLSDGPTGAFKDMAMQPFAHWLSYLQSRTGNPLTILLSTSGDTGPAALQAFGGIGDTEIINMLPINGVSDFQWSQMAELSTRPGIHVLEVDGNFSDINDMHMEADLVYDLCSVNSVNIARIIAQIPYYAASYAKGVERNNLDIGDPIDISIPSGNFGNALSAIIARKMGVPIRNIIVATNENNTLDTLLKTGIFALAPFVHTDSSAQDVRMPSNIWRYLAMSFDNDPDKIAKVYQTLKSDKSVAISEIGVIDKDLQKGILSATITAAQRKAAMIDTYMNSGKTIMIDPHTANGVAAVQSAYSEERISDVPVLVMETAKPYKFNQVMSTVLGIVPPRPEQLQGLEERQLDTQLQKISNIAELMSYLAHSTKAILK